MYEIVLSLAERPRLNQNGLLIRRNETGLTNYRTHVELRLAFCDYGKVVAAMASRQPQRSLLDPDTLAKSGEAVSVWPATNTSEAAQSSKIQGHLTARESLILTEIVRGQSSKEVARALEISPRTVEFHRANLLKKFGGKNTAELVRKFLS